MTGTSGRQRVPSSCFDRYQIVVSRAEVATLFGEMARHYMQMIRVNDEQSRTLAALRDVLLPKLINGEIEIRDVERFVESAL